MINAVFALLNFCVFVAIFFYYFKKKIQPTTEHAIIQQKKFVESLSAQRDRATSDYRLLQEKMLHNQESFALLHNKVIAWRRTVAAQSQEKENQAAQYTAIIERYKNKQQQALEEYNIIKLAAPIALHNLTIDLQKYYGENEQRKKYVAAIVNNKMKAP